jgi:uncharacterized repeat protein (TIGR01451 family)
MKRLLWMLFALSLGLLMPFASSVQTSYAQLCSPITGSGTVVSETRTVASFSSIKLTDVGKLVVRQTGSESVTVTADDNLVGLMEASIDGATLVLGLAENSCIQRYTELTYTVTVDDLQKLSLSAAGQAQLEQIDLPALEVLIDGAGTVKAAGAVSELDITISGVGSFDGSELPSDAVAVTITGMGNATVNAIDTLNVVISGSGVVSYLGDPQITQTITGFGTVRRATPSNGALNGSFKKASQPTLTASQEMTYTIQLHNSSALTVTADVSDPLPEELSYVAGSASNGATLNGSTLSWDDLSVPAGEDLALTFRVTSAITVTRPIAIVNTATITSSGSTINRRATIVLLPEGDDEPEPTTPLSVENVVIGTQDVVDAPEVTIAISATGEPTRMYLKEWFLNTEGLPRWEVVQESGWISFENSLDWELSAVGGTHYIGVWLEDAEGNRSTLSSAAADYISLVVPDELPEEGFKAYLVAYAAGAQVEASLTTVSGDADLYIWEPGRLGLPTYSSSAAGTATDSIAFEAERTGTYVIVVYGAEASEYMLGLAPAGGPEQSRSTLATTQAKQLAFSSEPALSVAGQDPLGNAGEPTAQYYVYLPMVVR